MITRIYVALIKFDQSFYNYWPETADQIHFLSLSFSIYFLLSFIQLIVVVSHHIHSYLINQIMQQFNYYYLLLSFIPMGCSQSDGVIHPSENTSSGIKEYMEYAYNLKDTQNKNSLPEEQLMQAYHQNKGDLDKFLKNIQQKIAISYLRLTKQTLENMNNKIFIRNQPKVFLAEQVLLTNLKIMKVIGRSTNHKFNIENFKKLNKMQKNVIGYLKSIYPRNTQSFVSGDLMKVFKSFDMVEHPSNDILRNANFYIGNTQKKQLVKSIKKFINTIIDELDLKFPAFQKLLQERAFVLHPTEKQKSSKTLNYKIGRKLPQNVPRYADMDSMVLQIKNPQIFRVIVKWVSDMEQYLLSPQDEIEQKLYFKTVNELNGVVTFDDMNSVQLEGLMHQIISLLEQQKISYKNELKQLRKDMDLFNNNLVKILEQSQRNQKYVPEKSAQVIKYAMFNTKLLSWILSEKLLLVMGKLIKIGKSFQDTSHMLKVDLIKFNVTDMMRAMVTGSKNQIMAVYDNMKKLQQEGEIRIIKIKNRLSSPLNDAMIIFTMKQSFLICELQLILSESYHSNHEKLKNIETLNHFLYELQRSPYGVLSQTAVVLGYNDNKISYQDKIHYFNHNINFENCQLMHPKKVEKIRLQQKPFICTQCTLFYERLQNIFVMKVCTQCNNYLCSKCLFQKKMEVDLDYCKYQLNQAIKYQISLINQTRKKQGKQYIQITPNFITENFKENIFKLSALAQDKKSSFKIHALKKYLDQALIQEKIKTFIFVQFKNGQVIFTSLFWNEKLRQIQTNFKLSDFDKENEIKINPYDALILFDKKVKLDSFLFEGENTCPYIFINIFKRNYKVQVGKQVFGINMKKYFFVICEQSKQKASIEGVSEEELEKKKSFKYASIKDALDRLPQLKISRATFSFPNTGITDQLLLAYKNIEWRNEIKEINLAKNKLISIQVILENSQMVQKLYVSENFISKINFSKKLIQLKVFNASKNMIVSLENLNNIPQITKINVQCNRLINFEINRLPKLYYLNLNQNKFISLKDLSKCFYPQLSQLHLSNGSQYYNENPSQSLQLNCPSLRSINIQSTYLFKDVSIVGDYLQRIILTSCRIKQIRFNSINVKTLNISNNLIQNINFISQMTFNLLQQIDCSVNLIKDFPIFKTPNLKILNFSNNLLQNINNIENCQFSKVQQIFFSQNYQLLQLAKIPCKNLKKLQLSFCNQLKDINKLNESQLLKITQLNIVNCIEIQQFTSLNLPELQKLNLTGNTKVKSIDQILSSNFPLLKQLSLDNIINVNFPSIDFPSLQYLSLNYSNFKSFKGLQTSYLPKITTITSNYMQTQMEYPPEGQAIYLTLRILPKLNLSSLKSLSMIAAAINDISAFSQSTLSSLQTLYLSSNPIQILPIFILPSIKELNFESCKINNVSALAQSQIFSVEQLNLASNKITIFPKLKLQKLKNLNIQRNQIQNLTNLYHSKFPLLENLSFEQNKITKIPNFQMQNITLFNLTNNPLKDLKGLANLYMPNLKTLNISNLLQQINEFPSVSFNSLEVLQINNSKLKNIMNLSKCQFPYLKEIYLSYNQFTTLPILSFPLLEVFSSPNGKLQDVKNLSKWNCPSLINIDLSYHSFNYLPKLNFPKLVTFTCEQNKIQNLIQFDGSNLPNLQTLILDRNMIKVLPKMQSSPLIATFQLRSNKIQNIDFIKNYQELTYLYLSQNKLTKFPAIKLKKLAFLQLSDNLLQNIDDGFKQQYPFLTQLLLNKNRLQTIPVIKAPNLCTINLQDNKIKQLKNLAQYKYFNLNRACISKNLISKFPKLNYSYIECYNNQIQYLDVFLNDSFDKIYELNLNSNKIKKISSLKKLTGLKYLHLDQNLLEEISFMNTIDQKVNVITVKNNKIKTLCKIKQFKQLYQFDLSFNPINNLKDFLQSQIKNTSFSYSLDISDPILNKEIQDKITNVFPASYFIDPNQILNQVNQNNQQEQLQGI